MITGRPTGCVGKKEELRLERKVKEKKDITSKRVLLTNVAAADGSASLGEVPSS